MKSMNITLLLKFLLQQNILTQLIKFFNTEKQMQDFRTEIP